MRKKNLQQIIVLALFCQLMIGIIDNSNMIGSIESDPKTNVNTTGKPSSGYSATIPTPSAFPSPEYTDLGEVYIGLAQYIEDSTFSSTTLTQGSYQGVTSQVGLLDQTPSLETSDGTEVKIECVKTSETYIDASMAYTEGITAWSGWTYSPNFVMYDPINTDPFAAGSHHFISTDWTQFEWYSLSSLALQSPNDNRFVYTNPPTSYFAYGRFDGNYYYDLVVKYKFPQGVRELDVNSFKLNAKMQSIKQDPVTNKYSFGEFKFVPVSYWTDSTTASVISGGYVSPILSIGSNLQISPNLQINNYADVDLLSYYPALRNTLPKPTTEYAYVRFRFETTSNEWYNFNRMYFDYISASVRYVKNYKMEYNMQFNFNSRVGVPSNFPTDSKFDLTSFRLNTKSNLQGSFASLQLKRSDGSWDSVLGSTSGSTGQNNPAILDTTTSITSPNGYVQSDGKIHARIIANLDYDDFIWSAAGDPLVRLDMLKLHIEYKIKQYAPSYFYADNNNPTKILWRVDLSVRKAYNIGISSLELHFPTNYEILSVTNVESTVILTNGINYNYANPSDLPPEPSDPVEHIRWELETYLSFLDRPLTISSNVAAGDYIIWFQTENALLDFDYYSVNEEVQYRSEFLLPNSAVILEMGLDDRFISKSSFYNWEGFEISLEDWGTLEQAIDFWNLDYHLEDINQIVTDTTWDMDTSATYSETLIQYSSIEDYLTQNAVETDYSAFYNTGLSYSEFIYLGDSEMTFNRISATLKSNTITRTVSQVTQKEDLIKVYLEPTLMSLFTSDIGLTTIYKDKRLPRQAGFWVQSTLFKVANPSVPSKSYFFNETHFGFQGTVRGWGSAIPATVVLSLYEPKASNLVYTRNGLDQAIDQVLLNNLSSSLIISPTAYYHRVNFGIEQVTSAKYWMEVNLIPMQSESSEFYVARRYALVDMTTDVYESFQLDLILRGNMPRMWGGFYLQFNAFTYVSGSSELDMVKGAIIDDYSWTEKAFVVTGKQGNISYQVIKNIADISSPYAWRIEYEKNYPDASYLLINYMDAKRLTMIREEDVFIVGCHSPNIVELVSPSEKVDSLEPISVLATVEDVDNDLVQVQYQTSYWLPLKYKGSALDPDNDQLYETDWQIAKLIEGKYGFEYNQSILDGQIEDEFYQIFPTSHLWTITYKAVDGFLNYDYRSFIFDYNPELELTPTEGDRDLSSFGLEGVWALHTWANYSIRRNNISCNQFLAGEITLHSSLLYTPLRFRIDLTEEFRDARQYAVSYRYNYLHTFNNKDEISYMSIAPSSSLYGSSVWDFGDYWNVASIAFNYETPRAALIQDRGKTFDGRNRYTFDITITSRHNFTIVNYDQQTLLFGSNFDWFFYQKKGAYYENASRELFDFRIIDKNQSPNIHLTLANITTEDAYTFRIVAEEQAEEAVDLSPYYYSLLIAAAVGLGLLVFVYGVGGENPDSLYSRWGATRFWITMAGIIAGTFAVSTVLFLLF